MEISGYSALSFVYVRFPALAVAEVKHTLLVGPPLMANFWDVITLYFYYYFMLHFIYLLHQYFILNVFVKTRGGTEVVLRNGRYLWGRGHKTVK